MPDIRDHRDGAQPQRVNGKLSVKPGYLQAVGQARVLTCRSMVPRHGSAILRPAAAALLHTTTAVS
jgi:hypothetical protein